MKLEQLKKVVENHRHYIDINGMGDLQEMIEIVEDLLVEEIECLETNEPYATKTINETRAAREIVRNLYHTIGDIWVENDSVVIADIFK